MNLLYRLVLGLIIGGLTLLRPFSARVSHFLKGRKGLFDSLRKFRASNSGPVTWFHVASLGEYEQARPVIASLKKAKPSTGIVVSFFSPSGYDHVIKKPQPNVAFLTYLPLDTKENAVDFVSILKPELAFFVKYDLWFHHIQALKHNQIPVFLIAASLREDQSFFGTFGAFFRQNLLAMNWVFTQNEKSIQLLQSIGYHRMSIAGDTRFDRVAATAEAPKSLPEISKWVADLPVVVVGSAWDEDMELLIPLINSRPGYRWIIAPHDIQSAAMDRWAASIGHASCRFSTWDSSHSNVVLFIDNIGMLASLYQFAKVAYVGGAFGKGLHNILEPLGFGVPVIFGQVKRASKFPEAAQSQSEGCGFAVSDPASLRIQFESLEDDKNYQKAVASAGNWVKSNLGAADRIIAKVEQLIAKQ